MTDARVAHDAIIGDLNNGWAVANTTLAAERSSLGAGGAGAAVGATPGTIAGNLERRAGDLVGQAIGATKPKKADKARDDKASDDKVKADGPRRQRDSMLVEFARSMGKIDDPVIRQDLVRLHTLNVVGGLNSERLKAMRAQGRDIPGMANISKLQMSDVVRLNRDLGLKILGANGMLHAYTDAQREALDAATGNPFLGLVTGQALYAQAPPIYGGTDQIQKNIIGERVLGLPKEPGDNKNLPFSELPKNV
jgi:alkylation response protein AidB-like acyl-CoA dehydrogenase